MPPDEKKFDSFTNYKNELKIPFIIYADTEAVLKEPETEVYSANCSTQAQHHHQVHSVGYYFKCENDPTKSRYASFRGQNCVEWFMGELKEIASEVFKFLEDKKPMRPLTEEEGRSFNETTNCHICKKSITEDESKVKDHCHISGEYRGAAHQTCNLQYQISRSIPVVMHNLSGMC